MFKNVSPDLVQSGTNCPANLVVGFLSGQETHMPSPIEPYYHKQKTTKTNLKIKLKSQVPPQISAFKVFSSLQKLALSCFQFDYELPSTQPLGGNNWPPFGLQIT